ncbi:hypothetical protein [Parendozoicomonas haliclonae]|uniref:Ankyrin repeats (3 copies) n=1 Tax=Parendozoicomonas haliclonae TaxID=1960125 RepID=A0A1X7AL82_9GAMM|nr:hypothetical protein [Parendozoicomonas haliclonae]SMA47915.1 Ankyrin repeats (3 copies) [Parendozoicomonas haliclonae]
METSQPVAQSPRSQGGITYTTERTQKQGSFASRNTAPSGTDTEPALAAHQQQGESFLGRLLRTMHITRTEVPPFPFLEKTTAAITQGDTITLNTLLNLLEFQTELTPAFFEQSLQLAKESDAPDAEAVFRLLVRHAKKLGEFQPLYQTILRELLRETNDAFLDLITTEKSYAQDPSDTHLNMLTELTEATPTVTQKNAGLVAILIQEGCDLLWAQDRELPKYSPLVKLLSPEWDECSELRQQLVEYLKTNNINLDQLILNRKPLFMEMAIMRASHHGIQCMLDAGADVNIRWHGQTTLFKLLAGYPVDAATRWKFTRPRRAEIIKVLLNNGASLTDTIYHERCVDMPLARIALSYWAAHNALRCMAIKKLREEDECREVPVMLDLALDKRVGTYVSSAIEMTAEAGLQHQIIPLIYADHRLPLSADALQTLQSQDKYYRDNCPEYAALVETYSSLRDKADITNRGFSTEPCQQILRTGAAIARLTDEMSS